MKLRIKRHSGDLHCRLETTAGLKRFLAHDEVDGSELTPKGKRMADVLVKRGFAEFIEETGTTAAEEPEPTLEPEPGAALDTEED